MAQGCMIRLLAGGQWWPQKLQSYGYIIEDRNLPSFHEVKNRNQEPLGAGGTTS